MYLIPRSYLQELITKPLASAVGRENLQSVDADSPSVSSQLASDNSTTPGGNVTFSDDNIAIPFARPQGTPRARWCGGKSYIVERLICVSKPRLLRILVLHPVAPLVFGFDVVPGLWVSFLLYQVRHFRWACFLPILGCQPPTITQDIPI